MRGKFLSLGLLTLAACARDATEPRPEEEAPESSEIAPLISSTASPKDVIPGQYIIVFKRAVGRPNSVTEQISKLHGVAPIRRWDKGLIGFAAKLPPAALEALRRNPNVAYIEQDQLMYPDSTRTSVKWGLDRIDQRSRTLNGRNSEDIITLNDQAITIYIMDTGIRFTHSEFIAPGSFFSRASNGADFVGTTGVDCHGHGTHVAAIAGGRTYGVAYNSALRAVRVFGCSGGSPTSTIISGVNWVTSNGSKPSVVNMSLSGSASTALDDAVNQSINAGFNYVISAGNGTNNNGIPVSACTQSPSRVTAALVVGATDASDTRASFSNFGTCVDLFAPGVGIFSAWHTSNTATNTLNGTSQAAPFVAGTVALLLKRGFPYPGISPAEVTNRILSNATTGVVVNPGSGSPNRLLYSIFPLKVRSIFSTGARVGGPWSNNVTVVGGVTPYLYNWSASPDVVRGSGCTNATTTTCYTTYTRVGQSTLTASADDAFRAQHVDSTKVINVSP